MQETCFDWSCLGWGEFPDIRRQLSYHRLPKKSDLGFAKLPLCPILKWWKLWAMNFREVVMGKSRYTRASERASLHIVKSTPPPFISARIIGKPSLSLRTPLSASPTLWCCWGGPSELKTQNSHGFCQLTLPLPVLSLYGEQSTHCYLWTQNDAST